MQLLDDVVNWLEETSPRHRAVTTSFCGVDLFTKTDHCALPSVDLCITLYSRWLLFSECIAAQIRPVLYCTVLRCAIRAMHRYLASRSEELGDFTSTY